MVDRRERDFTKQIADIDIQSRSTSVLSQAASALQCELLRMRKELEPLTVLDTEMFLKIAQSRGSLFAYLVLWEMCGKPDSDGSFFEFQIPAPNTQELLRLIHAHEADDYHHNSKHLPSEVRRVGIWREDENVSLFAPRVSKAPGYNETTEAFDRWSNGWENGGHTFKPAGLQHIACAELLQIGSGVRMSEYVRFSNPNARKFADFEAIITSIYIDRSGNIPDVRDFHGGAPKLSLMMRLFQQVGH